MKCFTREKETEMQNVGKNYVQRQTTAKGEEFLFIEVNK